MQGFLSRFLKNQSGATAIEYALIAAFISLVLIASAILIGTELEAVFSEVDSGFKSRPQ